ncbi:hypothetical protein bcCo53_001441 (plasmid) [Borrelia coriaceae]|uniref:BDR-repeat family protein n=1 Tax=Borrelia coriaceae ATCC 43381 TaxID=1408429 RepID=W5T337_9SPIR|nr:Bdr family repetitive protein [Borrelia coriaceae]AHH11731.1 BDR-repeat family protein [Borrelia coriaceae ATCC 43381]UPA17263.1 hypothetical protein bcCo53_001441 [Borrelia coriaceae]
MGLPQPAITQQMVIAELTKAGINKDIAIDLSYRYYRNELTYKDIEFLKENFDIKLEKVETLLQSEIQRVEANLQSEIKAVKTELDNKIDNVENNLNNKIDNKFNELDNKIDNVSNEIALVRKDMEINKMELNKTLSEFDNKLKLHKWMFTTIITISIGILLTLIFK